MRIIRVHLRSRREFEELSTKDHPHGGLFCPTTTPYEEGEQVMLELSGNLLPNKLMIRGVVKSWRKALPRLRIRAGAEVAFDREERDKGRFLHRMHDSDAKQPHKRRHTRIPVECPAVIRIPRSPTSSRAEIVEISRGGALVRASALFDLGTDVTIEATLPGTSAPVVLAGRVTYHVEGHMGVKFLYRDGAGSHRLKELVRRIRAA